MLHASLTRSASKMKLMTRSAITLCPVNPSAAVKGNRKGLPIRVKACNEWPKHFHTKASLQLNISTAQEHSAAAPKRAGGRVAKDTPTH